MTEKPTEQESDLGQKIADIMEELANDVKGGVIDDKYKFQAIKLLATWDAARMKRKPRDKPKGHALGQYNEMIRDANKGKKDANGSGETATTSADD